MEAWFSGKPKEPGLYWFRRKNGSKSIIRFHGEGDYLYGFSHLGYDGPVGLQDFEKDVIWFGPLVSPQVKEIDNAKN